MVQEMRARFHYKSHTSYNLLKLENNLFTHKFRWRQFSNKLNMDLLHQLKSAFFLLKSIDRHFRLKLISVVIMQDHGSESALARWTGFLEKIANISRCNIITN